MYIFIYHIESDVYYHTFYYRIAIYYVEIINVYNNLLLNSPQFASTEKGSNIYSF